MNTLDDRVQQAQDHLSSIAEDGSYIHDIIELLDELYALIPRPFDSEELIQSTSPSEEQIKAQIAYGKRCAAAWGNHSS
jgi:hypothetical protein